MMNQSLRQKRVHRLRGFTLIELMVVVVILGVLAALIVPQVMDRPDQARETKAKQDIRALQAALDLYKLDNFSYPTTDQALASLVPKYISRMPKDPWGNKYRYLSPGVNGAVDIYTYGADNLKGGTGSDQDIGNWDLE
ncbi:MAG: type II secretion system major pseudopilin GspG [Pseudomonadota bacterium]